MFYTQQEQKGTQLESNWGYLYYWLNLFSIALNFLQHYIVFEVVVLYYNIWIIPVLYLTHLMFTIYNLMFTLNYSKSVITQGVFISLSWIINLYSFAALGFFGYWWAFYTDGVHTEHVVIIFLMLTFFFGVPVVQTFTFRLLRKDRSINLADKLQSNTQMQVQYLTGKWKHSENQVQQPLVYAQATNMV